MIDASAPPWLSSARTQDAVVARRAARSAVVAASFFAFSVLRGGGWIWPTVILTGAVVAGLVYRLSYLGPARTFAAMLDGKPIATGPAKVYMNDPGGAPPLICLVLATESEVLIIGRSRANDQAHRWSTLQSVELVNRDRRFGRKQAWVRIEFVDRPTDGLTIRSKPLLAETIVRKATL